MGRENYFSCWICFLNSTDRKQGMKNPCSHQIQVRMLFQQSSQLNLFIYRLKCKMSILMEDKWKQLLKESCPLLPYLLGSCFPPFLSTAITVFMWPHRWVTQGNLIKLKIDIRKSKGKKTFIWIYILIWLAMCLNEKQIPVHKRKGKKHETVLLCSSQHAPSP